VLVPKAFILGAREYHVQQGTVISLVCIVENVRKPSRKKIECLFLDFPGKMGLILTYHKKLGSR